MRIATFSATGAVLVAVLAACSGKYARNAGAWGHRAPRRGDGGANSNVIQGACYYGDETSADKIAQALPGLNWVGMSIGQGFVSVDGQKIQISATRVPGQDANLIIQQFAAFAEALGAQPSDVAKISITTGNVGGKNVYVATDKDGAVSYHYPSQDVLFSIQDATPAQAAKILAAIQ